ncbi:hypothetical protein QTP88_011854 [Uroleucon formosanum]
MNRWINEKSSRSYNVTYLGPRSQNEFIDILRTDNLVFQSYDYASNMFWQFNGTQAKLSELVGHSVFYIPCQVHRINTFLEHVCNSSLIVSDMIDNLENLYVFFSAKATIKNLEDINSDSERINDLINSANLFAANLVIPLYKIFSFPFKNENMSIENIQNALLIFPPNSDFTKCKDIEAIEAELEILKEICKNLSLTMTKNFLSIIEKCEEVKHILPLGGIS